MTANDSSSVSDVEFTVVIPARNEEKYIANCLSSVLSSTVKLTKTPNIIVVDDCSTDATSSIASAFGVRTIRPEHRSGQLAAWAAGIAASTSPIVIFVDADCTVAEDTIELLLRALLRPEVGVASGRPVPSDRTAVRSSLSGSLVARSSNFSSLLLDGLKGRLGNHDFVAIGRLLAVRRTAWKIDNTALPHNDREVASAARRSGWRVVWVPEATVTYEFPATFRELQSDWERTSRSRHPQAPQQFDAIPRTAVFAALIFAARKRPLDALSWISCRFVLVALRIRRGQLKKLPQPVLWD